MSSLSAKETRTVLRSLELQGAILSKTKKGILVKFPNGTTTTMHWTNSDHRSTLNTRAEIKRAGLQWPFDHDRKKSMGMAIDATRREALNRILAGIDSDGQISALELGRLAEVSGPTATTALKRAGFEQVRRGVWKRAGTMSPWGESRRDLMTPQTIEENEKLHAKTLEADNPYPEIEKAKAALVIVPEKAPEAPPAHEIDFIDERDSWTIPVPKKLLKLAGRLGLNIEVRVWRDIKKT